jgi:glycosyltransferase involved in cell wall biosynthesis
MDRVREHMPGIIEDVSASRLTPYAEAVSVVIPAYNEGPHVASQIRAVRAVLERTGWEFEILVVDDGSDDATGEAAAAEGVRVLRHRRNRGYGASLKSGIEAARHDRILIIDADGTYPPEAIPALLEMAATHEMVVGARTGETVRVPLARRPAKWFLSRLASYLAERDLPDINSGLRLIDRRLVESYRHLLPDGFSFTTTITLAATVNGHEVGYVPISYHARLGNSKIRPRHAFDFTLLILRTIVYFNPLRVFIPMGAMLALAGLAKFAYDVVIGNLSESAVLALLGALIIWAVGLLADQNARILRRR